MPEKVITCPRNLIRGHFSRLTALSGVGVLKTLLGPSLLYIGTSQLGLRYAASYLAVTAVMAIIGYSVYLRLWREARSKAGSGWRYMLTEAAMVVVGLSFIVILTKMGLPPVAADVSKKPATGLLHYGLMVKFVAREKFVEKTNGRVVPGSFT